MSDTYQPHWCVEPFDSGRHVRTGFYCGVPVLDEWLLSRAGQSERRDLARVYVLVAPGDPTVRGGEFFDTSPNSLRQPDA